MADVFKVPLVLTEQPEGGFTVTSPVLPELITEGDTLEEAVNNVNDALTAVLAFPWTRAASTDRISA